MRPLAIVFLLIMSGCAPIPPVEVGPYLASKNDVPACSQITVSKRSGAYHWPECQVR